MPLCTSVNIYIIVCVWCVRACVHLPVVLPISG